MEKADHFQLLRDRAEGIFGRKVSTTSGFVALSNDVARRTGETLSPSTLKRFWGYISTTTRLSVTSLDILARYVGFASFSAFCSGDSSIYLDAESISARALPKGAEVEVRWTPGRRLILRHLGGGLFRVEISDRSKLLAGDCFEVADFIVGFPLYLGRIIRDGKELPAYVAGSTSGLTMCRVVAKKL